MRCALIATLLTNLLKKEAFKWTVETTTTFEKLKVAITIELILALPQFLVSFTIKIGVLCIGV